MIASWSSRKGAGRRRRHRRRAARADRRRQPRGRLRQGRSARKRACTHEDGAFVSSHAVPVMRKELRDFFARPPHADARAAAGPAAVPGADARHRHAGREPRARPSSTSRWKCRWSAPSTRRTWCAFLASAGHQGECARRRSRHGDLARRTRTSRCASTPTSRKDWRDRPAGLGRDRARQHAPGFADIPVQRAARRAASRTASRSARCACSRAASIRASRAPLSDRATATSPRPKPSAARCWRSCRTC